MQIPERRAEKGFTIVELLIVIVVIAILVVIVIVTYSGIQSRANDAAVKQDMSNFAKQVSLFYVDNGRYPTGYADLAQINPHPSKNAYYVNGTMNNYVYCVAYTSATTVKSPKVVIGSISKSMTPYYWYNQEGQMAKIYTGPLVNGDGSMMSMNDICQYIMGEPTDYNERGYLTPQAGGNGWQSWVN